MCEGKAHDDDEDAKLKRGDRYGGEVELVEGAGGGDDGGDGDDERDDERDDNGDFKTGDRAGDDRV